MQSPPPPQKWYFKISNIPQLLIETDIFGGEGVDIRVIRL